MYLLIGGPFAFGVFAAILMFLLLDIVVFNDGGRDSDQFLKRVFGVLGWFLGNEALITGTLWAFDLRDVLGIPHADGVAFLGYLAGFGMTGSVLGITGRRQMLQYHFSGLYPDLTHLEARSILLTLRYGVTPDHAAEAMGLSPSQFKKVYAKALSKLARRNDRQ